MAFRGLKTLTALNIAVLLILGMGIVGVVGGILHQKALIDTHVSRGELVAWALSHQIVREIDSAGFHGTPQLKAAVESLLEKADIPCILVMDRHLRKVLFGKVPHTWDVDMEGIVRRVLNSGKETVTPFGDTWGVFWKQDRGVVVSVPLTRDTLVLGSIGVLLSLEKVYADLRRFQKLLLIYILVNGVFLTGIGLHLISRAYFRPIRRLARRAESYSEEDALPFFVRKEDSELGRLSQSLNFMLKRIAKDKKRLKSTIASLEKANQDLKEAQQEIIRTEKLASMGRLASGIAHEIGNPLGIVGGYLELLKHSDIDEKERNDYIRRSIQELDRIHAILRQLLDFTRSPGKGATSFSVHETVADVVEMLKPQPLMSGITLKLSFSARKDRVWGDPDQVRQVFLNLILNAADALATTGDKAPGVITIATQSGLFDGSKARGAPQIQIRVSDNGPGIPEEKLDRIFEPFYTTKAPGKGTGLGLWVSGMIIEGLGGRIRACTGTGKGSTLEVVLPLHEKKTANGSHRDPGFGRPDESTEDIHGSAPEPGR